MKAASILREAANIVERGWCQRSSARNSSGSSVVNTAHVPPNMLPAEKPMAPVSFDVGSAIFRAASQPASGGKDHLGKLGYRDVPQRRIGLWQDALMTFCRHVGCMHHAQWNDEVCTSADEAARELRAAADQAKVREAGERDA